MTRAVGTGATMSNEYFDPQDEEHRERAAQLTAAGHMDDMAETGDTWQTVARHKSEFYDRLKEEREEPRR